MIDIKQLPKNFRFVAYCMNGEEIIATVNPVNGRVLFEGYIHNKYVPYSRSNSITKTAAAINNELGK